MSSLETSVTLDDVFTVVEAKRVPLAPELAGYLTLEIADGTDAGSGDVDPKTVFISEEGTVALVRPKKDGISGDAEASVRKLLTKLLEASGSGTPALTTAAKRKPGNGLPALVEELEAALIPVNRAAGRRALARLAREVKRVLLGVGRNASGPPVVKHESAPKIPAAPHARPVLRKKDEPKPAAATDVTANLEKAQGDVVVRHRPNPFDEEPRTAKRSNDLAASMNEVERADDLNDVLKNLEELPKVVAEAAAPPPKPVLPAPVAPPSPPAPVVAPPPVSPPAGKRPEVKEVAFGRDDVDSLLESFGVSDQNEDKQVARELKAIAGLSPTPPPPDAKTLAELTKDVGKDLPKKLERRDSDVGDGVEALLALADASAPLPVVEPEPPKVKAEPPPAPEPQPPPANLPPSPIFGSPASAAAAADVPGAPAALRQSADALPPLPPESAPAPAASSRSVEPAPASRPDLSRLDKPRAPTSQRGREGASKKRTDKQPRAPRTGMALLIFALIVVIGGTAAVWKFAPQIFTGKKRPVFPVATSAAPTPAPPKCKVALVLTDVPANAEILLRMGQAPVDVERMPVGTRLELVATAEGHAPRRAVIKAESPWDKGPDGKPRIEVPIQLDPSKAKPGAVDPWPAAEPGSQVGGSGAPGTVHVVSNVRGAEVWLLAGLGPEARIDQLRCDADIDVLLAGPPALRRRLHVSDKDIEAVTADANGNKVVNVSGK